MGSQEYFGFDIRVIVTYDGDTVNVTLDIALNQLRDLNEPNQYLSLVVWFRFWWRDNHLQWKPSEHENITELRFRKSEIWIPDIFMFNHADEQRTSVQVYSDVFAVVQHTGSVYWPVPAVIKTTCKIDMTFYPFDIQRCPIKLGSWSYNGNQLDVYSKNTAGDTGSFIPHGEFDVLEFPAKRNVLYHDGYAEPFPDITYTVVIRRKSLFYIYNLVFPCVLLLLVCTMVFILPPESGEKNTLAIMLLLSMTVFLLNVAENMPATSDVVPLIGKFFGTVIVIMSLSAAFSVMILNIHFYGLHGDTVPPWIKMVVLRWMARPIGFSNFSKGDLNSVDVAKKEATSSVAAFVKVMKHVPMAVREKDKGKLTTRPLSKRSYDNNYRNDNGTNYILNSILTHMETLNENLWKNRKGKTDKMKERSEWQIVAMIVDRYLLILVILMSVIASLIVFINNEPI
ncbi:unnamed protein product [Owenia fusiformis]|uniref:Uncharacterized protein n=1 Tax=Owenia fusiformis TaxID=6347 RepID=A0A8J1XM77_OWEFU|nr:unnamed protein product [Owenia fusiformis]